MQTIHQDVNTPQKVHKVIEVSAIQRGEGDIIATFNLRVRGILIRQCSLRQGRSSVYLNFPSRKDQHGRWDHLVEFTSSKLERFVQEVCYKAVAEVVR